MTKSSSQIQAENIAAYHAGKCTPAALAETDEQFLLRMSAQTKDWKPSMALWVDARELRRLVSIAREREVGRLTACAVISALVRKPLKSDVY